MASGERGMLFSGTGNIYDYLERSENPQKSGPTPRKVLAHIIDVSSVFFFF